MIQLRDYQSDLNDRINEAFASSDKVRDVCAVLSTGGGKSVILAKRISDSTLPVALLVHRTELVSQLSIQLARFGVRHRIIAPSATVRSIRNEHFREFGKTFDNPNAQHMVASVDTLLNRIDQLGSYLGQVSEIITDEAAHQLRENKWGVARQMFKNARGVGFTATPCRADGKGLGRHADGFFDVMVRGPTTGKLIANGHLSRYKIIAKPSDIDLSDVAISATTGDYSAPQVRKKSHESHIVGDVVQTYIKHALGKQGIVFTVDVETANELAEQFRQAGVPAASVSAKTDEAERQDSVRRFRNGELKVLTNCDLFGEGFDVPGVEVVSLARPTMSLSLHLQQVGRALRPAPGKQFASIIDHVGNWERHGLPDSPRNWTLDGTTRKERQLDADAVKLTTCLECFLVFERKLLPTCPYCGCTREPSARRAPEQVDGDLFELDPDVLAALRESVELPDPADVARKIGHKAGRLAGKAAFTHAEERIKEQAALRDAIALWAGVRKERGQSDSVSYREFFLRFGVDVLTVQTLPRREMEEMRERVERDT